MVAFSRSNQSSFRFQGHVRQISFETQEEVLLGVQGRRRLSQRNLSSTTIVDHSESQPDVFMTCVCITFTSLFSFLFSLQGVVQTDLWKKEKKKNKLIHRPVVYFRCTSSRCYLRTTVISVIFHAGLHRPHQPVGLLQPDVGLSLLGGGTRSMEVQRRIANREKARDAFFQLLRQMAPWVSALDGTALEVMSQVRLFL